MKLLALAVSLLVLSGCGPSPSPSHFSVAYETSSSLALDVYRPNGATGIPTVVFVHGGAFRSGGRSDGEKYARRLVGKGIEVISINYRLTSSGAAWPAPLDDVRSALRWVRAHADALGAGKIGVMGSSAGACLAELVALEDDPVDGGRPACLVSISGYGDLFLGPARSFADFDPIMAEIFGHPAPFSDEELLALSPARHVRVPVVPTLIAHSIGDGNVFVDQGDAFAAACPGAEYLRRSGWAHGDDLWNEDGGVRAAVAAFLLEQLRR